MAIRLRKGASREWAALCAAETEPLEGDIYLDDGQHYALTLKYIEDWTESGLYKAETDKEPNRMAEGSSFANYMCKLETWAEAYDQEAVVMSPEELEALYDDAFFEAMDLEKEGTVNYCRVIGVMPGPKLEPAFYLYSGGDAWPSEDTLTWTDDSGNLPAKAIGRGYCFDCDHPVEMEYDQRWIGDGNWQPPKTCQECGGHDVDFMGPVAERLWEQTAGLPRVPKPVFGTNIRDAIRIAREYIELRRSHLKET